MQAKVELKLVASSKFGSDFVFMLDSYIIHRSLSYIYLVVSCNSVTELPNGPWVYLLNEGVTCRNADAEAKMASRYETPWTVHLSQHEPFYPFGTDAPPTIR
jgi:hypothetical protein